MHSLIPYFLAVSKEGKSITVRASNHGALRQGTRHCEAFRFDGIANKVHITEVRTATTILCNHSLQYIMVLGF